MNLWVIFLTGLTTGGVSCAAVQGGLLAGVIANQKSDESAAEKRSDARQALTKLSSDDVVPVGLFLVAKLISHTLLGFLLGWLGSRLELSLTVRLIFQGVAALFVLATAANLLELHPIFRYAVIQPPRWIRKFLKSSSRGNSWFAPAFLGLMTVLIPCGVTQSMELLAVSTANPWLGAGIMFAFVLGTSPIFALIGLATAKLSEKFQQRFLRIAAALLIFLGISSLNGILVVLDAPVTAGKITRPITYFFSEERFSAIDANGSVQEIAGVQQVTIDVTNEGYSPRYFKVRAGAPVELTISSHDAYSCAVAFTFKKFGIATFLQPTESQTFAFTPTEKGRFTYACSMGMYTGIMEVI